MVAGLTKLTGIADALDRRGTLEAIMEEHLRAAAAASFLVRRGPPT
jgi:hypothetical protein